MQKTLTREKLVLFVYDEISNPLECNEIARVIKSDNELYQQYNELKETKQIIDSLIASPSANIITGILNYSKALNMVHTSDHKTIGLVMN